MLTQIADDIALPQPNLCQQNYEGDGFSVEDEMSVKIGPVNNACRECAGPEVISSSRVCASRKFLQSQKGRENDERYTRAIKLLNNNGTTAVIECLGQIYSRSELVDVLMPFKNVTYPNR